VPAYLHEAPCGGVSMLDLLMLALALFLFAVTVGYAVACARL
jgi:hypothetical protein